MSVLLSFDNLLIRMYLLLQCSLASYITDDEIRKGILFPSVSRCVLRLHTFIQNFHPIYSIILNYDEALTSTHTKKKHYSIRHITARVGAAVLRAAVAEDLAEGIGDVGPSELSSMPEVLLARRQSHTTLVKRTTVSEISFFMC
jgi:hypothetical protein